MRIGSIRTITRSAAAIAAALLFSGSALAHSGEIVLVAEPATVAPGETLTVRADLPSSGSVGLSVTGSDGSVLELGVVEATDEGHFEVVVRIPVDLPAGPWSLRAHADGAELASTSVEVTGAPIGGEQDAEGGREEEDPLLAALPSGWQASRSGPPARTPAGADGLPKAVDLVSFAALGVVLFAVAILVGRTRPDRPSGGPTDPSR